MNQQVAVIRKNPFGLIVAFHALRQLGGVFLQLHAYLVGDSLNLPLICSRADDEIVRKRSNPGEIQNPNIGGFLGFGGADGEEPGWRCGWCFGCFRKMGFGQITLLSVSYYSGGKAARHAR